MPHIGLNIGIDSSGGINWASYWTPSNPLPDEIAAWISDQTISNGGKVSELLGDSVNKVRARNSDAATQPELITSYANGQPALKFNITSEHHLDFGNITLTNFSIHIVFKQIDDLNTYQELLSGQADGTLKGEVYTNGSTAVGVGVKDNVGNKVRLSKIKSRKLHVATLQNDKIYIDGLEIEDYQTADTLTGLILSRIGTRTDGSVDTLFWNGFLLECRICSSKNDYATIMGWHEYAINRYGIKTPTFTGVVNAKHIGYECGVYRFGWSATQVFFSSDSGANWTTVADATADQIESSYIFDNGNLFFTKRNHLYGSTDGLININEIVPTLNGSPYLHHTPTDPAYPGSYYFSWDFIHKEYIGGSELAVWGNYAHALWAWGAAPINIYSCDNLLNAKVIYQFGQSLNHRDDGTALGGVTGTILGDATNPLLCDHIHDVAYDKVNDYIYVGCGDSDNKCPTIRGKLSGGTWTWTTVWNGLHTTRWWGAGLKIIDGIVYWGSEYGLLADKGIYRCKIEDYTDIEKHEALIDKTNWGTDGETYDVYLHSLDGVGLVSFSDKIHITQNGFKDYVQIVIPAGPATPSWYARLREVTANVFAVEAIPLGLFTQQTIYLTVIPEGTVVLPNGKPSALTVTNLTCNSQRIDFTIGATNQTGHIIENSLDGVTFTEHGRVSGATATYTATGLLPNTLYYWRCCAYNGLRNSNYSNVDSDTTANLPASILDGHTKALYDYALLSTITTVSGKVTSWRDLLASGNDLIHRFGFQDLLWTSDGILSNGIDESIQGIFAWNQPAFIIAVMKQVTWTADGRGLFDGAAAYCGIQQLTATPTICPYSGGTYPACNDLAVNTWAIIRILFNGASSKLIINNNAPITFNGAGNPGGLIIGSGRALNSWSNSKYKEIILKDIAPSGAQEIEIYNYLAVKYGFATI
jgi:hypothetical protein